MTGKEKGNISVLIVEDDPRIAEINRRFIEKVPGYEVIGIATDRQLAEELLEILQPDLVLLDIYFPDMNGLEFLRHIKRDLRFTDVIMITAGKEVETIREALAGGVYDYIVKPVIFQRFENTLLNYKDYRKKLTSWVENEQSIGQEEIDQLIQKSASREEKKAYLPKGIDRLTLEKVSEVIKNEPNGLTADEVGKEIGVSRSTARRYLEHLVSERRVTADLSYGVVGRPERIYSYSSEVK